MKYTLRRLGFLLILALLIASPFTIQAYQSATTTDPYILIAREIEGFEKGGVDVLSVEENTEVEDGVLIVTYIEDYPNWSLRRDQENFKSLVLQAISKKDFSAAVVAIGWDFPPIPPEAYRVQGIWVCGELRRNSCTWEQVPSTQLLPQYTVWAGIGKP